MMSAEEQYLGICKHIVENGTWVENKRTGQRCLTVLNADIDIDCSNGELPVLTTRKMNWKGAVAEMLGYVRGYNNAGQFNALGTKTWDANAAAPVWVNNKHYCGPGDMGRAYGVQWRQWLRPDGTTVDQLRKVVNDLKNGIDDRREIVTAWNPGELDRMCLAPCVHTHTFSLLGGTLYLTSYQRSADMPLGVAYNMIQVAWFLYVIAAVTGKKPGIASLKMVNAHIYENQLELMRDVHLQRTPYSEQPCLLIKKELTFDALDTTVTVDDFDLTFYKPQAAINYPFSV